MKIDDKAIVEKIKYYVNREAAKKSALSSSKIDKTDFFLGERILPNGQMRITEQANFAYSPLGKAFEKQIKKNNLKEEKKQMLLQIKARVVDLTNKGDYYKSRFKGTS